MIKNIISLGYTFINRFLWLPNHACLQYWSKMGGLVVYLDTILVPFSLFLTAGYHVYLWLNFKKKPFSTTIGINEIKRRAWFRDIQVNSTSVAPITTNHVDSCENYCVINITFLLIHVLLCRVIIRRVCWLCKAWETL